DHLRNRDAPAHMYALDGIIFSLQRHGGISVYFRALIEYLSCHRADTTLMIEKPARQEEIQQHSSIQIEYRAARSFERYRPCRVGATASVFHSSYYRLPERDGIPTVTTVHDFVYERYAQGPRRWVHIAQKHRAIRAAQAVICISE